MVLESRRAYADRVLLPLAERLRAVDPNVLSWLALLLFAVLGQFTAIQRGVSAWRRLGAA